MSIQVQELIVELILILEPQKIKILTLIHKQVMMTPALNQALPNFCKVIRLLIFYSWNSTLKCKLVNQF